MEAILEPLLRSPKLRLYVDELTETLRREQEARERFRESLNEDVRAEFINGEVFVHSPARDAHTLTVQNLTRLLTTYVQVHRLGTGRSEQALTAFTRNDYGPDICFWKAAQAAGFKGSTTVYPVPDFICEVLSPGTENNDRQLKFEDYAAHGVEEYGIVDPEAQTIEQYVPAAGRYQRAGLHTSGSIRSSVVEGFVIPVAAAFDETANLQALRVLLNTQTKS